MSAARALGLLFLAWGAILAFFYGVHRLDVALSHWRWKRHAKR